MTWLRCALAGGAFLLGSMALAMPALSSDGSEFACEEAVAHLASCCPELDPTTFDCERDFGCGADTAPPTDLDLATSRCLVDKSCERIRAAHICQAAENDPETVSCQ